MAIILKDTSVQNLKLLERDPKSILQLLSAIKDPDALRTLKILHLKLNFQSITKDISED
jgi:uncharacterized protein YjgD (DUF1641 family)